MSTRRSTNVPYKNISLSIGILLDDTLDKPDGVQQYVTTIGEYFKSLGHTVHYIVAETQRQDLSNIHGVAKFVNMRFNGNTVRTPLPVSKEAISTLIQELDLDVLHVQMPFSPFFAAKVIKAAPDSCRIVGTWHTFPSSKLHYASNVALSLALRPYLKRMHKTIGVSKATAEFADKAYGTHSIVIPNAVNVARFKTKNKRTLTLVRKVVFLGRFVDRKGPLYMIDALQEIKRRGFDMNRLEIVMAGKGPLLEYAQNISAKMGLHISFPGFIKENEKAALLESADITVFPSTGGEAFGISLVEAMSTGTSIVIGGDNAGYRSVLEKFHGQIVDPKNAKAFADTLLKYLAVYGAGREKIIASQLKEAAQYDVSVVCAQLLKIYREKTKI